MKLSRFGNGCGMNIQFHTQRVPHRIGGCPALNVDSDVKRESERANALRAVLWMDKHNPNAFIP